MLCIQIYHVFNYQPLSWSIVFNIIFLATVAVVVVGRYALLLLLLVLLWNLIYRNDLQIVFHWEDWFLITSISLAWVKQPWKPWVQFTCIDSIVRYGRKIDFTMMWCNSSKVRLKVHLTYCCRMTVISVVTFLPFIHFENVHSARLISHNPKRTNIPYCYVHITRISPPWTGDSSWTIDSFPFHHPSQMG